MRYLDSLLHDDVVILGLIGAFCILALTIAGSTRLLNKIRDSKAGEGVRTGEVWDGIEKLHNDLPVMWTLFFIGIIIWGFWYFLFAYPLASFSQVGQYNAEVKRANSNLAKKLADINHDDLLLMGGNIFQVQCSQCHGIDKGGIGGKAMDLNVWGRKEGLVHTILNGSKGLGYDAGEMPAVEVTPEEANSIADFIYAKIIDHSEDIEKPPPPSPFLEASITRGQELFAENCAACHGDTGLGMEGEGMENYSPNLSTYGNLAYIDRVLTTGKSGNMGRMPSFKYVNFSNLQKEALRAFIHSN